MNELPRFSAAVSNALAYYVYLYIRPDTGDVFYIGKGKGNRALAHVDGKGDTPHDEVIRQLQEKGLQPRVEILVHGLKTAAEALAVEMAAIDLLGLSRLSNSVHGHHKARRGRMTLQQIKTRYEKQPATITEPAILIRIARGFRYGMTPVELYDITRSSWVTGERRNKAQYAMAVHEGMVREVYRITGWLEAGSTFRVDHPQGLVTAGRWEFVGVVAADDVRSKYLDRQVNHYFSPASQNPILYVNC